MLAQNHRTYKSFVFAAVYAAYLLHYYMTAIPYSMTGRSHFSAYASLHPCLCL